MATYSQTPGLLNIKGVVGAHFSCQLDFDTNLTGYTFDSAIVLQEYPTKREQAITVTVDNAAQGIITLSITENQSNNIGSISGKKWYLNWEVGGLKRTILAGNFELSDIPLGQNETTSTGVTIEAQDVNITLSAFSNAALDGKQPLNAALTQISGLSPNNDDFLQRKAGAWTNRNIGQVKADLGISNVDNTSDANKPISTATQSALNAKLNISTAASTYQPLDSDLTAIAGLTPNNDDIIQRKSGAWTSRTLTQLKSDLAINNVDNTSDADKPLSTAAINALSYKVNTSQISSFGYTLIDDADAGTARGTLGLGSMSLQNFSPVNGGIVYSGASSTLTSVAGTSGQLLQSNGTGAPTWISPSAISSGAATSTVVNNDNATNREYFPVFAYQSAGVATTLYGSSAKLKFNPSNGYLTAQGFSNVDIGIYGSGIHWSGNLVLSVEEGIIYDLSGNQAAYWGSGNGMYVSGTASKDVPLRLMDGEAANLSTGAYIIVRPSASATTNGTELRNAYAAAKAFTPQGSALSATNRATVLLLPGTYNLGTTSLTMDTEFVDLVGISSDPKHVLITSAVVLSDNGTIIQTADNVIIRNVSIDRTGNPQGSGAGRAAAYFPNRAATAIQSWTSNGTTATVTSNGHGLLAGDSVRITSSSGLDGAYTVATVIDVNSFTFASTVNSSGVAGAAQERFDDTYIENCIFSGTSDSGMRQSVEYSGTYKKCLASNSAFGAYSIASGLFEDCVAGNNSFGGNTSANSTASGTFKRCTAGSFSFGFYNCTGSFENCVAGGYSFGVENSGGTFSATLKNCEMIGLSSSSSSFTGTMRGCTFKVTGTNQSALRVGNGAKIFDSTLIATGTGNSITAGSSVTISLAGCRMNNSINANVNNNLGTLTESYNLIDSDIN